MVRHTRCSPRHLVMPSVPAFNPVAAGDVHAVTHRREHARDSPVGFLVAGGRGRPVRGYACARRPGTAIGRRSRHACRGRIGPPLGDGLSA
ncbi:hypothetical protein G6F40_017522 [Rhizopus arrhizus]|nr:hypothetical protein G6F40_017522 [Rhizopus arrhizus]